VVETGAENKVANYLLIAGAVLGLGAAMWSALGVGDAMTKYSDAIAVVDGTPIPRAVYETAIEGLASAKRNPLTEAERREALERIIDEELLLRRALDLGLAESDPPSRKALVNAILQFSVADTAKLEPKDDELRRFYAERPKLIAPQPLLTVRAVSFASTDAKRIERMRAALGKSTAFEAAVRAVGGELVLLPKGPVIPSKIAEYAGPTLRDAALVLKKGQSAGPIEIGRRTVFVHLIDRSEAPPPPLDDVRDVVAEEWRNRMSEKAFEDYVAGLRARARVTFATDAPTVAP
jgi:PPIC-type PPIASE domain/SurA-like N-terminal domain